MAENWFGGSLKPILEEGGVDLPEISVEGDILCWGKLESRCLSIEAWIQAGTEEKEGSSGAVIGSAAGVFGGATAEFGKDQGNDLLIESQALKIFLKRGNGF